MGNILKPLLYQGRFKKRDYFEGWYYKFVSPDSKRVIAIIVGVSKSSHDPHSFIQINDSLGESHYYRFQLEDFDTHPGDNLIITIKNNYFSIDKIQVDLDIIKGKITFTDVTAYRGLWPGIMGPFSFIPVMECNHGVLSLNHNLNGSFIIKGEEFNFTNGKGYIEKDWGRSFPRSWIWLQGNSFCEVDNSIMLSIANIPWIGKSFRGFLGFLKIGKKVEYFATYNLSKIVYLKKSDKTLRIKVKKRNLILDLEIISQGGQDLIAPTNGTMDRTIKESIDSVVKVKLLKRGEVIYSGESSQCGLELFDIKDFIC